MGSKLGYKKQVLSVEVAVQKQNYPKQIQVLELGTPMYCFVCMWWLHLVY